MKIGKEKEVIEVAPPKEAPREAPAPARIPEREPVPA